VNVPGKFSKRAAAFYTLPNCIPFLSSGLRHRRRIPLANRLKQSPSGAISGRNDQPSTACTVRRSIPLLPPDITRGACNWQRLLDIACGTVCPFRHIILRFALSTYLPYRNRMPPRRHSACYRDTLLLLLALNATQCALNVTATLDDARIRGAVCYTASTVFPCSRAKRRWASPARTRYHGTKKSNVPAALRREASAFFCWRMDLAVARGATYWP